MTEWACSTHGTGGKLTFLYCGYSVRFSMYMFWGTDRGVISVVT